MCIGSRSRDGYCQVWIYLLQNLCLALVLCCGLVWGRGYGIGVSLDLRSSGSFWPGMISVLVFVVRVLKIGLHFPSTWLNETYTGSLKHAQRFEIQTTVLLLNNRDMFALPSSI